MQQPEQVNTIEVILAHPNNASKEHTEQQYMVPTSKTTFYRAFANVFTSKETIHKQLPQTMLTMPTIQHVTVNMIKMNTFDT